MNNKTNKTVYYIATGLLTVLMLFSAGMYVFNNPLATEAFINLGFPTYIIYPLAAAKVLGLIAIWTKKSNTLTHWAYAGFFFCFVLAVSAHLNVDDGEFAAALVAIVLLLTSYFFGRKIAA